MKTLLSLAVLTLALTASAQTWEVYRFNGAWQFTPFPATSGFDFTEYLYSPYYMAGCLTTTNTGSLLGDMRGKLLSASVGIQREGNPQFVYGGQFSWNPNGEPANVRMYFSTNSAPYSVAEGVQNETGYWWNSHGLAVQSLTNGSATGNLGDLSQWSDANGHRADDPAYTAAFYVAAGNVRQIGLFFGGGSFYDVGVSILHDTGTARFTLNRFTSYAPMTLEAEPAPVRFNP